MMGYDGCDKVLNEAGMPQTNVVKAGARYLWAYIFHGTDCKSLAAAICGSANDWCLPCHKALTNSKASIVTETRSCCTVSQPPTALPVNNRPID